MKSKKTIEKQIKNLPQYKNYTKKELKEIVDNLYEKQKLYQVDWAGLNTTEEKKANEIFKNYIDKYNIEKFSDLEDLKSLVQTEIIIQRIQKKLGESEKIPSKYNIDSLTALQKHIMQIKEKLGIFQEKDQADVYNKLKILMKKFKKWEEQNQGTRTRKCPYCSKMVMFHIRTDKYDIKKHPFFKDSILTNEHLIKLYKDGKLTKEDVAKVLNVSPDYVKWLVDRWEN